MSWKRLLSPFSWSYARLMKIRRILYQQGILKSIRPGVWTISVGNLSLGGTGKTPVLDFLMGELEGRFKKILVISRGYRSLAKGPCFVKVDHPQAARQFGDESVWLAKRHPSHFVVVGPCKRDNLAFALEKIKPDLILIDDGFQSLGIRRDRDLVLVDSTSEAAEWRVFPEGRLREPVDSLSRADLVGLTKVGLASKIQREFNSRQVAQHFNGPVAEIDYQATGPAPWGASIESPRPSRWILVSGIARPEAFRNLAKKEGEIVTERIFRDHHPYTQKDVLDLIELQKKFPGAAFLTTEKDATKLSEFHEIKGQLWALPLTLRFLSNKDQFLEKLLPHRS